MNKFNAAVSCVKILFWTFVVGVFIFTQSTFAQDFPKEIRGYKVHRAKISVKTAAEKSSEANKSEAVVKISEPELIDVSLSGATLEISAEIDSIEQSGTVDFLAFHDFRVNDLAVEIEEYRESFDFKKNERIKLPKPIKIFVGTGQALRGAFKELKESKNEWTVTGTIFVFGQFKKSFFKFKRVVPVKINLKIKNPLNDKSSDANKNKFEILRDLIVAARQEKFSGEIARFITRCSLIFCPLLR